MQCHVDGFVSISQNHVVPQRVDIISKHFLDCALYLYGKVVVFSTLDLGNRHFGDRWWDSVRFDCELRADGNAHSRWVWVNRANGAYYVAVLKLFGIGTAFVFDAC